MFILFDSSVCNYIIESLPTNNLFSDEEEDDVEDEDVTEPPIVAEKPTAAVKSAKRKRHDPGVESRKRELLCQRAAEHKSGVSGEMKTFIQGLFTSFKDMVQKEMQERFDKVDTEVANIKETMSQFKAPSDVLGKTTAAEIPTPSRPIGKDQDNSSQSPGPSSTLMQDQAKSSQTPRPSAGKGRANVSVDPSAVRRSPRTVRKVTTT
ncbi:unnamed protein product [Eruca vesicaria subsp. sativa]|uniref:Uncharacterized protein n=1 Tax=Eruca vesicaria subsp. sativa TaxID=29727 RepID=A0ABC8KJ21_ERUVS|nr:unnamed protein product [Eruca vesicaria subsp. sativa]